MDICAQIDGDTYHLNLHYICGISFVRETNKYYIHTVPNNKYEIDEQTYEKVWNWMVLNNKNLFDSIEGDYA